MQFVLFFLLPKVIIYVQEFLPYWLFSTINNLCRNQMALQSPVQRDGILIFYDLISHCKETN